MNTSIHEMWIKTMCDLVASNEQIFIPIFVSLLATPERNGRNFNSIYPTKCPSSKKVSSLLLCCLSNCGKENKEVWHKWRMLIQIEIQKKTWGIFIFWYSWNVLVIVLNYLQLRNLNVHIRGGCYCQCFHKLKIET